MLYVAKVMLHEANAMPQRDVMLKSINMSKTTGEHGLHAQGAEEPILSRKTRKTSYLVNYDISL